MAINLLELWLIKNNVIFLTLVGFYNLLTMVEFFNIVDIWYVSYFKQFYTTLVFCAIGSQYQRNCKYSKATLWGMARTSLHQIIFKACWWILKDILWANMAINKPLFLYRPNWDNTYLSGRKTCEWTSLEHVSS